MYYVDNSRGRRGGKGRRRTKSRRGGKGRASTDSKSPKPRSYSPRKQHRGRGNHNVSDATSQKDRKNIIGSKRCRSPSSSTASRRISYNPTQDAKFTSSEFNDPPIKKAKKDNVCFIYYIFGQGLNVLCKDPMNVSKIVYI